MDWSQIIDFNKGSADLRFGAFACFQFPDSAEGGIYRMG